MKARIDWKKVNYFSPTEHWGDVSKIDPNLIYGLDIFRHGAKAPFHVNNAFAMDGHSEHSQHYLGKAVDGYLKGINWLDQLFIAIKSGQFTGIGVYPDWNNPGLHLDIRDSENGYINTWIRYKGEYMNLTHENITMVLNDLEKKKIKKPSKKLDK